MNFTEGLLSVLIFLAVANLVAMGLKWYQERKNNTENPQIKIG